MLSPISQNKAAKGYNQLYLQKKDSNFVSVRLTSSGFTIGASGIANATNKSALLRLRKEHLNAFLKYAGTSLTDSSNELTKEMPTTLSGVLQVQESFEPFYEGQSAKINPSTQEVVMMNGKPIYRQTVFLGDAKAPDYVFVGEVVEEKEVVNTSPAASPAEAFNNVPA